MRTAGMGQRIDGMASTRGMALTGLIAAVAFLAACSGGDPVADPRGTDTTDNCTGSCASSAANLTVTDVQRVLAQGIAEAQARSVNATFAVVDRVGNVLAVYRMGPAANRSVTITSRQVAADTVITAGLEEIRLPVAAAPVNIDHAAAISKALTGAYLFFLGKA